MAVLAHESLDYVGIDSQIALVGVDGKESFGHAYVIMGHPIEPRYLGMYLQDNIEYDNPYEVYNSTKEFVNGGYTIFPTVSTVVGAVLEL